MKGFSWEEVIDREEKNSLSAKELLSVLPHRFPMLLLDSIIDYETDKWAIGKKMVSIDGWYFNGHYPDNPIFPGSLLLEAMSQAATFLVISVYPDEAKPQILFAGAKTVRFLKPIYPGDELTIYCHIIKSVRGLYTIASKAKCTGEIVGSADIILKMTE